MYDSPCIIDLADIYTVGAESGKQIEESKPFVHRVQLQGPKGEKVRLKGIFDGGAMINTIDTNIFKTVKHRLAEPKKSNKILCMASGTLVPSEGRWRGKVEVCGEIRSGEFKIFPSGGLWALLFGKPLLEAFDMKHKYGKVTIRIQSKRGDTIVLNEFGRTADTATAAVAGVSLTADIKQREACRGNFHPPSR